MLPSASKKACLVVPGDLLPIEHKDYPAVIRRLSELFGEVVYVLGNHEFYSCTGGIGESTARAKTIAAKYPNVHILDNEFVEIDGAVFYGGTLWFPQTPAAENNLRLISDFIAIPQYPEIAYKKNKEFRKNLLKKGRADIVVSHHCPLFESGDPRYAGHKSNCYFISDEPELIKTVKPVLWIHGHTHSPCDYRKNKARVVCNPYGYPGERYNPQIIKIDIC